jgi:hypothetical protein
MSWIFTTQSRDGELNRPILLQYAQFSVRGACGFVLADNMTGTRKDVAFCTRGVGYEFTPISICLSADSRVNSSSSR